MYSANPEPSHHNQSNLLRLRSLHDHTPPNKNFTSRKRTENFVIHHSKSKATTRIKKTTQNISLDFKVACKPELFSNHAPFLFLFSSPFVFLLSFYAVLCWLLRFYLKYSLFKTIAIISIHYPFLFFFFQHSSLWFVSFQHLLFLGLILSIRPYALEGRHVFQSSHAALLLRRWIASSKKQE